jgi:hypothetical protein
MNVIAIDPGQTTGLAILLDTKYLTFTEVTPEEVWNEVNNIKWDHVVCENFTTAGRISSYGLLTVRIIGGIQAICWLKKMPLHMRMPQHRNSKQKQANTMATVIHERDALAHLLAWEASIK